jgi:hypothetical protein
MARALTDSIHSFIHASFEIFSQKRITRGDGNDSNTSILGK